MLVQLVLVLIALIFFALATFNVPARWNLVAAGLFAVVLADHLSLFHR